MHAYINILIYNSLCVCIYKQVDWVSKKAQWVKVFIY